MCEIRAAVWIQEHFGWKGMLGIQCQFQHWSSACVQIMCANLMNLAQGRMFFSSKTCAFQIDCRFLPIPHLISDSNIHSLCSLILMSFSAAKSWDVFLSVGKKQDFITARSTTSMAFLAPEDPSLTQLFRKVGNWLQSRASWFDVFFKKLPSSLICLSFYLRSNV